MSERYKRKQIFRHPRGSEDEGGFQPTQLTPQSFSTSEWSSQQRRAKGAITGVFTPVSEISSKADVPPSAYTTEEAGRNPSERGTDTLSFHNAEGHFLQNSSQLGTPQRDRPSQLTRDEELFAPQRYNREKDQVEEGSLPPQLSQEDIMTRFKLREPSQSIESWGSDRPSSTAQPELSIYEQSNPSEADPALQTLSVSQTTRFKRKLAKLDI